jgi:hypothetical protein
VRIVRRIVLVIAAAMLVVFAGLAAVIAAAATPTQVLHANQTAAVSAADQMLGDVVLPAGSTAVPSEPAGDEYLLAHSFELPIFAAEVDRHEFWTTTASPKAVIASFEADLPAGAKSSGSAYNGAETSVFASYSLPTADAPALGPRSLSVDAVELSDGSTGVRADADVRYTAPRPPDQRIPPQARVLDITEASPHASPLLSLTVTNHAQVRHIAAVVDGLPFVASLRGVAFSCPAMMLAPTDTFTFRASSNGPALAQVTEPADWPTVAEPCFITTFRVRGHGEPGLLEGGKLLRRAGAILGVKLTTRP